MPETNPKTQPIVAASTQNNGNFVFIGDHRTNLTQHAEQHANAISAIHGKTA